MNIKSKTYEIKAEDNGTITGYASTWTREPDSYGDVIAKGAFAECLEKIKADGKVLPLLFNHDSDNLGAYIGTVIDLEEDDHGLKFTATFDDTPEAQRARELALSGRLVKFSFAYDIEDQAEVELEDGRKANELRKLNIHEVSLVLYPANPDTSVVDVKSGRRNSAKDTDELNTIKELTSQISGIIDGLLADQAKPEEDPEDEEELEVVEDPVEDPMDPEPVEDPEEDDDDEDKAKSEEPDTANDEEQARIKSLLTEASNLLSK